MTLDDGAQNPNKSENDAISLFFSVSARCLPVLLEVHWDPLRGGFPLGSRLVAAASSYISR